jgi:HD domain
MSKQKDRPPAFIPSASLTEAFRFASEWHAHQVRNGTSIPYLSHLMGVASLVMEHGGDEEQTIAALLHDAIEDVGIQVKPIIVKKFGDRVAKIVEGCTDGVPDEYGQKTAWRPRKERYVAHLRVAHDDVILVSGCDKLHNARAIVTDLDSIGLDVFKRFSATRDEVLWYYGSLVEIFEARLPGTALARELRATFDKMETLSTRRLTGKRARKSRGVSSSIAKNQLTNLTWDTEGNEQAFIVGMPFPKKK